MIKGRRIVNGRILKGYMERKARSTSTRTLKEISMKEYEKEYGEGMEEVVV